MIEMALNGGVEDFVGTEIDIMSKQ
jgi:hypothetical protein